MQFDRVGRGFGRNAIATVLVFLSLAGVVAGLTLLFLGMRSVMEIGGACADGGPYVSAQPCPDGVPLAMLGGIFGGTVLLLAYLVVVSTYGVPGLWALAWPALFLSLGWNFLEFGLDSPGDGGLEWGWLTCAVLFGLMGGVPLLLAGPSLLRSLVFGSGPPGGGSGVDGASEFRIMASALGGSVLSGGMRVRPDGSGVTARGTAPSDRSELVDSLERLAELRRRGVLTDEEFAEAKRRLLEEEE